MPVVNVGGEQISSGAVREAAAKANVWKEFFKAALTGGALTGAGAMPDLVDRAAHLADRALDKMVEKTNVMLLAAQNPNRKES